MDEPVDMIRTCKGTHEGGDFTHIYIIKIYIYVHKYNMEKNNCGEALHYCGGVRPVLCDHPY